MTEAEYTEKANEIERLLNDPRVPLDPTRIWSLLEEMTSHNACRAIPYDVEISGRSRIGIRPNTK